jgi:hypothetical protein
MFVLNTIVIGYLNKPLFNEETGCLWCQQVSFNEQSLTVMIFSLNIPKKEIELN